MSDSPAIHFEGVSKRFELTTSQPQTVLEKVIAAFSRRDRREKRTRTLWAVQDVSFTVKPGESLGIIGRNGSGKSTILKLASGILLPTEGRIVVRGRLSALLELGAGFHPDLTGRENIFLNGSILGMSKQDVARYYDSIVDFSELGDFIDMPVKHYSSGMYMRLGFSVAVHVEPDVLIIDEILAVGDQAFQNKCIARIYEMKNRGASVVLVSHNLDMVGSLCSHLLWIEQGRVQAAGSTAEVIAEYRQYLYQREVGQKTRLVVGEGTYRRWGTGDIEITKVRVLNAAGEEQDMFKTGDAMTIEIAYFAHVTVRDPEFGLAIFRQGGVQVNGPNNRHGGMPIECVEGPGIVRFHVPDLPLLPASYRLTVAVHDSKLPLAYDFHEQAYGFRVVPGGESERHGLVEIPGSWEWELPEQRKERGKELVEAME